jgi:disulfide bond formation protein DsbB
MVDPRGQRFAAAVTTAVLALVLLTGSAWLLLAQAAVFATAAVAGVAASPYARLFARLVRPRLDPPTEYEDARPPRFAQLVGLLFATAGLVGLVAGWPFLAYSAVGAALAAAFLNAAFGLCLGCEIYLAIRRTIPQLTEVTR